MITSNYPTFVTNGCGIRIKKCCASCQYKCLTAYHRFCSQHGGQEVEQSHVCPEWEMNTCFEKAGRNPGEVKKKEYLQFFMVRRWTENNNIELGIMEDDDRQTVEEKAAEGVAKSKPLEHQEERSALARSDRERRHVLHLPEQCVRVSSRVQNPEDVQREVSHL